MPNNINILVVGSGYMALEYIKVLSTMGINIEVVGRGEKNLAILKNKYQNIVTHSGGIERFIENNKIEKFTNVLNLVNVEGLYQTTLMLIKKGAKNILIEKPGALTIDELKNLKNESINRNCKILIAYNRRFYDSVNSLVEQTKLDGGIKNVHFEFTEWVHTIDINQYPKKVLEKWVFGNSSHVLDTVFHLIGIPLKMESYVYGKDMIEWHPSGSIFVGSGVSDNKIPFTYNSNWNSAGRWSIEVNTMMRKFYLCPMEKLKFQNKGEIHIKEFIQNEVVSERDEYKHGIYNMINAYFMECFEKFVTLEEQIKRFEIYAKISGYVKEDNKIKN